MNVNQLFYYCLILSVAGWILAFYFKFSQKIIGKKTFHFLEESNGEDDFIHSPDYVRFIESWSAGVLFASELAVGLGTLIAFIGSLLSILENSWWTAVFIFFVSAIVSQILISIFKKYSQLLFFFLFFVSITTILFHIF